MMIRVNVPKVTGADVLYQLIVGCVQCKHGEGLQYLNHGHTREETWENMVLPDEENDARTGLNLAPWKQGRRAASYYWSDCFLH